LKPGTCWTLRSVWECCPPLRTRFSRPR
jgi:hypothetical protein